MLEKIKEVVFVSQSYSSNGYDESNDFNDNNKLLEFREWTEIESNIYLIKRNNDTFIGTFLIVIEEADLPFVLEGKTIKEVLEFDIKKYGLIDNDGEVIEDFHICFNGCNIDCIANEPYLECFDIDELNISFIAPFDDNISLSISINNDSEQPIRAISNYLIKESTETKFSQKEFYQMVINSAQHELNLI